MKCQTCTANEMENGRLKRRIAYLENQFACLGAPIPALQYPDYCAACGHKHKTLSKHHRVPRRISWKIPVAKRTEVIGGGQHIVKLCITCHRFVESVSQTSKAKTSLSPCDIPFTADAFVTHHKLMEEIKAFEAMADRFSDEDLEQPTLMAEKMVAALAE